MLVENHFVVLNLEAVGKIQGNHELGWEKIASLFLLSSIGKFFFPSSVNVTSYTTSTVPVTLSNQLQLS